MSELDEMDREEFFRLKKVQGKKKRDAANADAKRVELQEQAGENVVFPPVESGDTGGADLLSNKDEDVIFWSFSFFLFLSPPLPPTNPNYYLYNTGNYHASNLFY